MEQWKTHWKGVLAILGGIASVGLTAIVNSAQNYQADGTVAGALAGAVLTVLLVVLGPRNETR